MDELFKNCIQPAIFNLLFPLTEASSLRSINWLSNIYAWPSSPSAASLRDISGSSLENAGGNEGEERAPSLHFSLKQKLSFHPPSDARVYLPSPGNFSPATISKVHFTPNKLAHPRHIQKRGVSFSMLPHPLLCCHFSDWKSKEQVPGSLLLACILNSHNRASWSCSPLYSQPLTWLWEIESTHHLLPLTEKLLP